MLIGESICPICNSKQKYEVKNTRGEKSGGNVNSSIAVIKRLHDNIFSCEITTRCQKCRINFKSIEEIEIS